MYHCRVTSASLISRRLLLGLIILGLSYSQGNAQEFDSLYPSNTFSNHFWDYDGIINDRRVGLLIGPSRSRSSSLLSGHLFYHDDLRDIPLAGEILGPHSIRLTSNPLIIPPFELVLDLPQRACDGTRLYIDSLIGKFKTSEGDLSARFSSRSMLYQVSSRYRLWREDNEIDTFILSRYNALLTDW